MGQVVQLDVVRAQRGRQTTKWSTKRQAAEHFKVHPGTINRWMKLGLPFDKPFEGGAVRFDLAKCDDWFRRRR